MRLEGVHHVTAITGDVLKNVDFYTRALGLRLVGKSVNQDDPSVYHVFFSDEHGRPGADITFFEYRGAARGRAGSGMVHRVIWRVTGEPALAFWEQRLAKEGVATKRDGGSLRFADPEGLEHELVVAHVPDEPRVADHPEIPRELALQGFHGVRAYGAPRGVGHERGGASALGGHAGEGERALDSGRGSSLLQEHLLPRAGRRAVRDRGRRAGLRQGRGAGQGHRAPAVVRVAPRAHRVDADPDPGSASGLGEEVAKAASAQGWVLALVFERSAGPLEPGANGSRWLGA
jgi:catechol 2,3-dioxygenase-like lactoylglutathione lyase family enzyme